MVQLNKKYKSVSLIDNCKLIYYVANLQYLVFPEIFFLLIFFSADPPCFMITSPPIVLSYVARNLMLCI